MIRRVKQLLASPLRKKPVAVSPPEERRAGSLSPLLQDNASDPYRPYRTRRTWLLGGGLAGVLLFSSATVLKLWPDIFPFSDIYRLHDAYWLPLKGWLWTAWYPWCLVLWLPVGIILALLAVGWASGHDPLRPLHRMVILVLAGLVRLRVQGREAPGMGLLQTVVGWARRTGAGASYIELVIKHALDAQFDRMETAVLAGRAVEKGWLRQADRLMRARALFPAMSDGDRPEPHQSGDDHEKRARWLEAFFDLAFLSHVDRHQDVAVADYLNELLAALDPDERPRLQLLEAFCAGRPLASCQGALWQALASLDQLSVSTSAQFAQTRQVQPGECDMTRLLAPCCFAFLAVADRNWSVASAAVLASLDRTYNALRLSDDFEAEADELAWWSARSRLATIRLLHETVHRKGLGDGALSLWPEGRSAYRVMDGSRLAAGGL